MTSFKPELLKTYAKRLATELNFSGAELMDMPFSDMVWWLTD